jgi:hypothetical protein
MLKERFIIRNQEAVLRHFAQSHVKGLNRIGHVDHLANFTRLQKHCTINDHVPARPLMERLKKNFSDSLWFPDYEASLSGQRLVLQH